MKTQELVHDVQLAIAEDDPTAAREAYQWMAEALADMSAHLKTEDVYCFLDLVMRSVEWGYGFKTFERAYMVTWIGWLVDQNPNFAVKMLKARYTEFYGWVVDGDWTT